MKNKVYVGYAIIVSLVAVFIFVSVKISSASNELVVDTIKGDEKILDDVKLIYVNVDDALKLTDGMNRRYSLTAHENREKKISSINSLQLSSSEPKNFKLEYGKDFVKLNDGIKYQIKLDDSLEKLSYGSTNIDKIITSNSNFLIEKNTKEKKVIISLFSNGYYDGTYLKKIALDSDSKLYKAIKSDNHTAEIFDYSVDGNKLSLIVSVHDFEYSNEYDKETLAKKEYSRNIFFIEYDLEKKSFSEKELLNYSRKYNEKDDILAVTASEKTFIFSKSNNIKQVFTIDNKTSKITTEEIGKIDRKKEENYLKVFDTIQLRNGFLEKRYDDKEKILTLAAINNDNFLNLLEASLKDGEFRVLSNKNTGIVFNDFSYELSDNDSKVREMNKKYYNSKNYMIDDYDFKYSIQSYIDKKMVMTSDDYLVCISNNRMYAVKEESVEKNHKNQHGSYVYFDIISIYDKKKEKIVYQARILDGVNENLGVYKKYYLLKKQNN
ncbi:hypothetical protein [Peptostreptococcus sp. D1]|uniref:hypothetical protein n=1 Tax=Peptostreptococcus sp. D1 TaxID=72304 RepID=UPI0008F3ABF0|nr:hypothetical protein [Peptostreptococcus sp. D1]SFE44232.1 hypothetical protein SAMN02910278_00852 [Peptostreptococcus sp. D1]